MVSCHVVESSGIKDVGMAYNGGMARGEVAGILLNHGSVVVKGKGDPNAEGEQGGGEATNAAEGVDCSEARRERWSGANGNPDIGWSDVEESESCGGQGEEEVTGQIGGRQGK